MKTSSLFPVHGAFSHYTNAAFVVILLSFPGSSPIIVCGTPVEQNILTAMFMNSKFVAASLGPGPSARVRYPSTLSLCPAICTLPLAVSASLFHSTSLRNCFVFFAAHWNAPSLPCTLSYSSSQKECVLSGHFQSLSIVYFLLSSARLVSYPAPLLFASAFLAIRDKSELAHYCLHSILPL